MILGIVNGAQGANIGFGMVMMVAVLFWLVALIGLLITKSKINRPLVLFLIVALGWFLFGPLISLPFYVLFPPAGSCPLDYKRCSADGGFVGRIPPTCEFQLCPEENLKIDGSFKESVSPEEVKAFSDLFPKASTYQGGFFMDKIFLTQCKNIEQKLNSLRYISNFKKCHN